MLTVCLPALFQLVESGSFTGGGGKPSVLQRWWNSKSDCSFKIFGTHWRCVRSSPCPENGSGSSYLRRQYDLLGPSIVRARTVTCVAYALQTVSSLPALMRHCLMKQGLQCCSDSYFLYVSPRTAMFPFLHRVGLQSRAPV